MFYLYLFFYVFLIKKRKYWDTFTRIISTLNALLCIYMCYHEIFKDQEISVGMLSLYYVGSDFSLKVLYTFSYYLLVDGIFQLPDFYTEKFSVPLLLSVLHHFVGSLGIYMIAEAKMGFFLGYYFAMTEISTPFLNLSWFFRNKILFWIFYIFFFLSRIISIPFLLEYLHNNKENISALLPIQSFMSFYGSYTLILLNCTWFFFLSKKLLYSCR